MPAQLVPSMTSSTAEVFLTAKLARLGISAEQSQRTEAVFAQKDTTAQEALVTALTHDPPEPTEIGRLVREMLMSAYLVLQAITALKVLDIQPHLLKATIPRSQVCQAWSLSIYVLQSSTALTQV